MKISNSNSLRSWVRDHINPELDEGHVDAITDAIRDLDHPVYGSDWSRFLAGLPDPLLELLEEEELYD